MYIDSTDVYCYYEWNDNVKKTKIYPHIFIIRDKETLQRITDTKNPLFSTREKDPANLTISIYDTFDWRLFKNKYSLIVYNSTCTFSRLNNPVPLFTFPIEEQQQILSQFPGNDHLHTIKTIITIRNLLCHATMNAEKKSYSIKKESESGEMEISIISFSPRHKDDSPPPLLLIVHPPPSGFEHFAPYLQLIHSLCESTGVKQDILFHMCAFLNKKPGNYTGKMNITLFPHMTTETACRIILSSLFHIMKQNEQGIKDNVDTEFLHDFRVSTRKTRSLLSQVKKVFPKKEIKPYRNFFKYNGKLTNRARDIDVYLLKMDEFRDILPGEIKKGLAPLKTYLKAEQLSYYRDLMRELDSAPYKKMSEQWQIFLNTPIKPEHKPSKADTPVLKTAKRVIYSQYLVVIVDGMDITDETPPSALHALRIECKKLRYLLEFFISLFPREIMKKIIAGLKGLQDNLGSYQDLHVQQEMLPELLKQMKEKNLATEETEKAIRFLVHHFHKKEIQLRREFRDKFVQFNSNENRSYFEFLCGVPSLGKEPSPSPPGKLLSSSDTSTGTDRDPSSFTETPPFSGEV
jgi:CHAD domain-containing protein